MKDLARPDLKKLRELTRDKKMRDTSQLFVAEGVKIVSDILAKKHDITSVVVSRSFFEDAGNSSFFDALKKRDVPLLKCTDKSFNSISSLKSSQGTLAVVKKPSTRNLSSAKKDNILLVLCDGVQDPGNIGTIIRTSLAFDADGLILYGSSVDPYNPKVVRASAAAVLDIPIYEYGTDDIRDLVKSGYRLLVSTPSQTQSKDISQIRQRAGKIVLAFGSEGRGVSDTISGLATDFFHIPIHKNIDSLNVAAAVAVSMYAFKA